MTFAARLVLATGLATGLLAAGTAVALPAHAAPADARPGSDRDGPTLLCGTGDAPPGGAPAECPVAVTSGGTHALAPSPAPDPFAPPGSATPGGVVVAGPAAPDDVVAAAAPAPLAVCGAGLAVAGDALAPCPPPLGGPPAPGDLAPGEVAFEAYLADVGADAAGDAAALDLPLGITVCGGAVAILGDAAGACPQATSAGSPLLVVEIPGLPPLELPGHPLICTLVLGLLGQADACPA